MAEPDREKMLRRRVYVTEKHLEFLAHLKLDSSSIEAEIFRRYERIAEAKESIRLHMARISDLMSMVENVDDHISQSQVKLRSLKRLLNEALIKKLVEEYKRVNARLEREDRQC